MIWNDFDLYQRINWYTQDYQRERMIRAEDRERLLASAREAEALAATLQSLADDLRRLAA